jgi:hypothetical protein
MVDLTISVCDLFTLSLKICRMSGRLFDVNDVIKQRLVVEVDQARFTSMMFTLVMYGCALVNPICKYDN